MFSMMTPKALLMPTWPDALRHVDFVRLKFFLDFSSPCRLQPAVFLGLGRLLRLAARQATGRKGECFRAALSDDPVALRRHQKPSPAFVVRMPVMAERLLDSGDRLCLEVLFLGTGIPSIHDFLASLVHLGRVGLVDGEGQFEVSQALSLGLNQEETLVWRQQEALVSLTPVVTSLAWWLETCLPPQSPVTLEFLTPTRLLADGRPLRRPRFAQIFPFMLRRVTSMLHACCGLEPVEDPRRLLQLAGEVEELNKELTWRDWRPLSNQGQAVGGFVGRMSLAGPSLDEILWVLATATLFGVGKSASYGAGGLALSA